MTRRVVHVTTTDMSLELLLGPQLRSLAAAGWDVIGASAPGPYVDRLGVRHEPLRHATRALAPWHDAAAFLELWRLFRRLRPEVVHTHNPKPGVYGRIAARLAGVPAVVNTVHGLYALPDDAIAKRSAVYALERLAATFSHAELVQNPEDIDVLRRLGIPAGKLTLLGNGIDLQRFSPGRLDEERRRALRAQWGVGERDVLVGAVGRLVWEKGYRELFEAAAVASHDEPSLRFVVVGPHERDKRDAVAAADLAHAGTAAPIVFLGARDDVEDLYGAFDAYVLASWREGFPRSAMEASASGLPVVATDIRGCRQVVDDGRTGILVPVRDPIALAAAFVTLARDADLRRRLGAAGSARARREFDQQRIIATTLETYDRLLGRHERVGDVVVRRARRSDAPAIARLHAERIAEGFLVTLGVPFLRRLYRRISTDPGSLAVVAEQDGEIVGFAAATGDLHRLYRSFAVHDGIVAGLSALPRVLRAWPRLLETARYPGRGTGTLPSAEVLSVAVSPAAAGRGIGRRVVTRVLEELDARGIDAARVVTVADNEPALAMYRACGFAEATRLVLHHGGPEQAVLVWRSS